MASNEYWHISFRPTVQVRLAVNVVRAVRDDGIFRLVGIVHGLRWIRPGGAFDWQRCAGKRFEVCLALVSSIVSKCVLLAKCLAQCDKPLVMNGRFSDPFCARVVDMRLLVRWCEYGVGGVDDMPTSE